MYSQTLLNVLAKYNVKNNSNFTIFEADIGTYKLNFPKNMGFLSENEYTHMEFFNELWKYYLAGNSYWFMEKQQCEDYTHTGFMFDFDLYLKSDKSIMATYFISDLIKKLAKIIYTSVDIQEGTETVAFYLANKKVNPEKDNQYKEGFHILFPGIQVREDLKKSILISAIQMAKEFFKGEKEITNFDAILDKNSSTVPVQLYGTIRNGKTESHKLQAAYTVIMCSKIKVKDIASKFNYTRKNGKTAGNSNYNIILETSIIYGGGYVVKSAYESRSSAIDSIMRNNTVFSKDIENSLEVNKKQVLNLIKIDHKARELNAYLMCINWGEIKENNDYGRLFHKIAKNILFVDIKFVPFVRVLASTMGEIDIKKLVGDVETILSRSTESRNVVAEKNLGAIKKIAKEQNPVKFEDAKKNTLVGAIDSMLASQSVITDNKIGTVVQDILKDCFYCVHVKKPGFSANITSYWMEYIIRDQEELQNDMKPFIYKWYKHDTFPKTIDTIITKDIAGVFESVLSRYLERKEQAKTEGSEEIIKVLRSIIKKCGDAGGIENIKKRCIMLMENTAQQAELDQDISLLGVYNGVLKFGKNTVKLLTAESRNAVSQTTGCGFLHYEPECKTTKKIMGILSGIIPNKAKMEGLLMHFSQCLVGNSCKRYFTILYSKGASGKTIWMALLQTALGLRGSAGQNSGFGYFDTVDASAFMMDKMDVNGVDHHLMKLGGARFIHLPEGKHKGVIQTHIIKKLREPFGVRGMYESLRPTVFTGIICMLTNSDKMGFSDYNYALYRRFLYVSFPITFKPKSELRAETDKVKFMDESLEEKVKKRKYGEAFFSILVHYWLKLKTYDDAGQMYAETGLFQETVSYIGEHNVIEKFIQTCLIKDVDANPIPIAEICNQYISWSRQFNGTVISMKTALDDFEEAFPNDLIEGELRGFKINPI